MKSEHIDGTILIDPHVGRRPHVMGGETFAACTVPGVERVQVDYAGQVTYAVTDTPGARIWWFAGVGNVLETAEVPA